MLTKISKREDLMILLTTQCEWYKYFQYFIEQLKERESQKRGCE